MKDLSWLKVALVAGAVALAGYFIGNMHKTGKRYDRYVQVKGLSEREVEADLAVWPINVVLTGNDLTVLKREVEQQNDAVYQFFIDQGFKPGEITRGMVNINDARANLYNTNAQNSAFRYLAQSDFTVRTREIGKLQKALAESLELMSKGIVLGSKNQWRPIEYLFTGLNEIKPSMVEEATLNAREVAEKFARDAHSEVGEIRIARQGLFSINDRDQNTPEVKIVRVVSTFDFQLKN